MPPAPSSSRTLYLAAAWMVRRAGARMAGAATATLYSIAEGAIRPRVRYLGLDVGERSDRRGALRRDGDPGLRPRRRSRASGRARTPQAVAELVRRARGRPRSWSGLPLNMDGTRRPAGARRCGRSWSGLRRRVAVPVVHAGRAPHHGGGGREACARPACRWQERKARSSTRWRRCVILQEYLDERRRRVGPRPGLSRLRKLLFLARRARRAACVRLVPRDALAACARAARPAAAARRGPGRGRARHRPPAAAASASCAIPEIFRALRGLRAATTARLRAGEYALDGRDEPRRRSWTSSCAATSSATPSPSRRAATSRTWRAWPRRGASPMEAFLAAARDPAPIRDLDPEAKDLEGYLFPDTYDLTAAAPIPPRTLVARMVQRFREVIDAGAARDQPSGLTLRAGRDPRLDRRAGDGAPGGAAAHRRGVPEPPAEAACRCRPTRPSSTRCASAGGYDGNIRKRRPRHRLAVQHVPLSRACRRGPSRLRAARRSAPCSIPRPCEDLYFVSRNDGSAPVQRDARRARARGVPVPEASRGPRPAPSGALPRRARPRPSRGAAALDGRPDAEPDERPHVHAVGPPPLSAAALVALALFAGPDRERPAHRRRATRGRPSASRPASCRRATSTSTSTRTSRSRSRARRRAPRLDLSRAVRRSWPRRCSSAARAVFAARRDGHRPWPGSGRRRSSRACAAALLFLAVGRRRPHREAAVDGGRVRARHVACGPRARPSGSTPRPCSFLCAALLCLVAGRGGRRVGRPRGPAPRPGGGRAPRRHRAGGRARDRHRRALAAAHPAPRRLGRRPCVLAARVPVVVLRLAAAPRVQRQRRRASPSRGARATSACSSRRPRACSSSRRWS